MWCSTCQRDCSPTGPADAQGLVRCALCNSALAAASEAHMAAADKLALPENDWELEADIRSVHRLVQSLKSTSRIDLAVPIAGPHLPSPARARDETPPERAPAPQKANLAAWSLLSLGLAVFACGAVLLGWSLAAGREDLWPLGMPLALAGQAALIVGLVLQLDGLWQTSRQTEKTLSELDDELSKVRQATTLLSTSHSGPSQSFYLHMAEGASPQLLLADLKGQLDLLAQQMRT
ncbi:MAG: hypothetical protein L0211_23360 [Planctomycetaceae bacterium]|nr:hypothetical protein [Planctomycetaceae bacterium]